MANVHSGTEYGVPQGARKESRILNCSLINVALFAGVVFTSFTGAVQLIIPSQPQGARAADITLSSFDSVLRASFGKASHVLLASVTNSAVYTSSAQRVSGTTGTLRNRQYLELDLKISRIFAPAVADLPGTIKVRLEAPGLEIGPFVSDLMSSQHIFLLKRDLRVKTANYFYPADSAMFFVKPIESGKIEVWAENRAKSTPPMKGGTKYYRVPGGLHEVFQDGAYDCWAAAAAIMLSWRDQVDYTKEDAARMAGDLFLQLLMSKSTEGLEGKTKRQFLTSIGLIAEEPQTFTVNGLRDLLEEHGPLWVTNDFGAENDPASYIPHARVIIAIEGDGSPEHSFVTYLDPSPFPSGERENIVEFTRSFEAAARKDLNAAARTEKQPFRPQILHF